MNIFRFFEDSISQEIKHKMWTSLTLELYRRYKTIQYLSTFLKILTFCHIIFAILNLKLRKNTTIKVNVSENSRESYPQCKFILLYDSLFFSIKYFIFSSFFHRHLSSKKNLGHLGKTVQALLNQVQKYVYDYNMGRMGQGNSNSSQTGA